MAVDKELVIGYNKALAGEEEGFNIIYNRTYSYVFARCRMIMKNDYDAMELLQETYVSAYTSLNKLSDVNNIFSWLGSIAYNQGMKIFRKKKDVLLDDAAEFLFDVQENVDVDVIPGYEMEIRETANIVKNIIDELPEAQRAVVIAYYYDEKSVNEIATLMEVSIGTIKSRLNYARKHIEEAVKSKEKEMGIRIHTMYAPILFATISMKAASIAISDSKAQNLYIAISKQSGMTALSALKDTAKGTSSTGVVNKISSGIVTRVGAGASTVGKTTGLTLTSVIMKTAISLIVVGSGTFGVVNYMSHRDNIINNRNIDDSSEVISAVNDEDTSSSKNKNETTTVKDFDNNVEINSNDNSEDIHDNNKESDGKIELRNSDTVENVKRIDEKEEKTTELTSEETTTENEAVENPDIETVEQESQTKSRPIPQATTQTAIKAKSEKKPKEEQQVEFDDMEF